MLKLKNISQNEKGYTLLGVLMVLTIFSVLGMSILIISKSSVQLSDNERDDQSVFYIAEAGVVEKVTEIEVKVKLAFDKINTIYNSMSKKEQEKFDFEGKFYKEVLEQVREEETIISNFEPHFGNQPEARIIVTRVNDNNPPIFKVQSVGNISGKNRAAVQELKISLAPDSTDNEEGENPPLFSEEMAVHVKKNIELSGSVKIYGDVATESDNYSSFKFSGTGEVIGEKFFNLNNSIGLPNFPNIPKYNIPPDQKISNRNGNTTDLVKDGKLLINNYISNGYILNMDQNLEYKEIILNENNKLTINLENHDREIVVDHLNVQNGHIDIKGTGNLTIYVREKITMGAGSKINENTKDPKRLLVYQQGSNEINLSGDQKIYGSLYAEQSNIIITGGGGFQGNIYSGGKRVQVKGGTHVNTQLFLVPNAKFELSEGGHIKGSIIADSFTGTGGGSVTFGESGSGLIPNPPNINYGDGNDLVTKTPLIEK